MSGDLTGHLKAAAPASSPRPPPGGFLREGISTRCAWIVLRAYYVTNLSPVGQGPLFSLYVTGKVSETKGSEETPSRPVVKARMGRSGVGPRTRALNHGARQEWHRVGTRPTPEPAGQDHTSAPGSATSRALLHHCHWPHLLPPGLRASRAQCDGGGGDTGTDFGRDPPRSQKTDDTSHPHSATLREAPTVCRASGQGNRDKGIVVNDRQGFVQFQGSLLIRGGRRRVCPPLPPPTHTQAGPALHWDPLQHLAALAGAWCSNQGSCPQKADLLDAPRPKTSF